MAIDAINPFLNYNKQNLGINQQLGGQTGAPKVNPFEPSQKVGGTQAVGQQGSAWAGFTGKMAVNDGEMLANKPMATTPQTQLGRTGVVGAQFRMLG